MKNNLKILRNFSYLFLIIAILLCFSIGKTIPTIPEKWNELEKKIRDNKISKTEAQALTKQMLPGLHEYFEKNRGKETTGDNWIFPVQGYGNKDIGGTKDSGYILGRYKFFAEKKQGTHPAFDIFIYDKNQNTLDDKTGKSVNILSVAPGIVMATNTNWETGSEIRGGNYIWIYDPGSRGIFYYAHMKEIFKDIGDIVKAGDIIGTVGRTGKSAYPKRSPTHLHIMYLKYLDDGNLIPVNIYKDLVRAYKIKRKPTTY